jgi:hypothetical protein
MNMGWAVFNDDTEVQRCDTCAVFPDDDAALAYAVRLGAQVLKEVGGKDSPRRRTGRRFKEILRAMEIAAEKLCPTFWAEDPSPEWLRSTVKRLYRLCDGEVTLLNVAYEMQEAGFLHCPTGGHDVHTDYAHVRDNLDHERLEALLRQAGCESFERWQGYTYWHVPANWPEKAV